jgi:hypothetical protein
VNSRYRATVILQEPNMADIFDDAFYARADAHIALSNEQADGAPRELVNASMLFASARFCAFLAAGGYSTGEAMAAKRDEIADYFVDGFRQMLEGNLDAYIRNFDSYMKPKA